MIRNTLVAGLLLFFCANQALADEKTVNVKVSMFGTLLVEYKVADKITLGLNYSQWDPVVALSNNLNLESTGSVGARAYWYPRGALQQGSYVTGFVDYASFDYNDWGWNTWEGWQGSGHTAVLGFISGYHWVWDSLNLSLGGGYGYMAGSSFAVTSQRTGASTTIDTESGGGFNFDLHIGFSF